MLYSVLLKIPFIICFLRSFAFDTVNRRMPIILTRVIDDSSKLASKLTHENDHVSDFYSTILKLNIFWLLGFLQCQANCNTRATLMERGGGGQGRVWN